VGVTLLHLCFLPWALGTMHEWSQLTSLALAAAGFVLAVLPRRDAGGWAGPMRAGGGAPPAARLVRLPAFWAGLAMLAYVAVQGLNPAWRFASNEDSWWLEPAAHVAWLPSGIAAPFARSNPWRALVIFGSQWLVVCSVLTGFRRRRSYRLLFTLLAAHAFLLAAFALVQLLSGTKRIFWTYGPSNTSFSGPFIYPNHAGPYLYLMVALAAGLALWLYRRSRHGLEPSGLAAWHVVVAAAAGLMVILSYSRGSIVMLLLLTFLFGCAAAPRLLRRRRTAAEGRPEFLPVALALAGLLAIGLVSLNTAKVRMRFAELMDNPTAAGLDRAHARQAATQMWCDRWLLGWGAGCFRHAFPLYAQWYPDIYNSPGGARKFWEHAHDDLIEFPAEFGVAGLLPLAGLFLHGAWQLWSRRFWCNPLSFSLVLGCCLVLLHAGVDFVLQNPAVLITWSVLLAGALRWLELDEGAASPAARA